ncbi:GDSL-type esterase/lipase family protein [Caulobacter sp. 17J80-11]|uniref:GDSL-type esterase/lipase family protein n=1 Tax=Caulobacter sp. 17J80-11 TaxID=2763502 RepID=UPI00165388E0|nr:GDSL-type esterase/lipase family protein [Caulobacter sp. 17J80-11]MBC6981787.1 SGNH/GDSL hydrolase family protein [Caulobacter sp. 17J80-11]
MRIAALALLLGLACAPLAAATAPERLSDAGALQSFEAALRDLQAGRRTRPVHVLQIGDSHSAADLISGALRDRLQARYGSGGRGVLIPGAPYPGLVQRLVDVQASGWRIEYSLAPAGRAPTPASGPYGLSGFRLVADSPGARLSLAAEPAAGFDRATVCLETGHAGADLVVTAGQERRPVSLPADSGPTCRAFDFPALQTRLDLTVERGGATVLSWASFRREGGVVLSNLGVVGAQLSHFAQRDDRALAVELEAYRPDLIVLAFGTNEGFASDIDPVAYEQLLRDQIRRLRRLSGGAPVLVLGAPDAATIRPDLLTDGIDREYPACGGLSEAERRDYATLVEHRSPALERWYAPPMLDVVRTAQRRAAAAEGAAFWDWEQAMGGACGAHALTAGDPPLMRRDHVHFTAHGGAMIAERLFDDLMRAGEN